MAETTPNLIALEPLYFPWEEPDSHRIRAQKDGEPAQIVKGRRPSDISISQNLRQVVTDWRNNAYPGVSDTTRELLFHWFERDHRITNSRGDSLPFHYYFCQREAVETLIYLVEARNLTSLSAVTAEFGGTNAELAARGINPEEDLWARYAFKVATGAGKTKIMSLAVVWSYFHALRESDSPMAKHFLIIAPNLTVFERLKEDFGNGKIFDTDPLIPPAWKGDWNLSVVLQDEASGAATGGILYLTNIHRLYEQRKPKNGNGETYDWMGPTVSKAKALDTSAELRKRITSHRRLMVLNDEAHHVWDPDSAWNEALGFLHNELQSKYGAGLTAQLDFSATPKDNKGNLFQHIICDTPLGEAVDAGIVKTPIIGRSKNLKDRADENAAYKFEEHLMLGYQRWLKSKEEWSKSGKKPLMFVMCENTDAANQIAGRLNSDPLFAELNQKTINLHTKLKGKLKKNKATGQTEFIEDEKSISDEDLRELRTLSRELDSDSSAYQCIVSVLMLREGWDVRNVTTIVPLRPYSSKANILPEQTLGRGLRRMTPPGEAAEIVTVVEHPAFASMYREQLIQEGLPLEIVDVEKVPSTTVSIFPDESKDLETLDILLPRLSQAHRVVPTLGDISFDEIKQAFAKFKPLPLGEIRTGELEYEGRTLFTNEIIEQMNIQLPLLQSGVGAVSYFREELERICSVRGNHARLAPLIQQFIEEVLFEKRTSIFDPTLVARLGDTDVREHIRAVFVPIIRSKTTKTEVRSREEAPVSITAWRPFQVTHSERHPTFPAEHTPFNLVPCNRQLEVAFVQFADNRATDIVAFSKNAGPQSLRIDYLAGGNRLAFYTPDFLVRKTDGNYVLVETKGREDRDVPAKARAAMEWCKSASTRAVKWEYLYIPEGTFQHFNGNTIEALARSCAPALVDLVDEANSLQIPLPFDEISEVKKGQNLSEFISREAFEALPSRYRRAVEEAIALFKFLENKGGNLAPCFTSLLGVLDEAAKALILSLLEPEVPAHKDAQKAYFEPFLGKLDNRDATWLRSNGAALKKALVYRNFVMPLGILGFCFEYAQKGGLRVNGVFDCVEKKFNKFNQSTLADRISNIRNFRNIYVAHQEKELIDAKLARTELGNWIGGLIALHRAKELIRISVVADNNENVSFYEITLDFDPEDLTIELLNSFRESLAMQLAIPAEDIVFLGVAPGSSRLLTVFRGFDINISMHIKVSPSEYRVKDALRLEEPLRTITFISYSRNDSSTVDKLYSFLKSEDMNPWLDRVDLLGGEHWSEKILKVIKDSTGFVFCLSKNSLSALDKKATIFKELAAALIKAEELGEEIIFLIPIRFELCDIPPAISHLHALEWDAEKEKLIISLRTGLERRKQAIP